MAAASDEDGPESPAVIYLPGEPAIIINGIPNVPVEDGNVGRDRTPNCREPCNTAADSGSRRNTGFGEWLEGREVRKLFSDNYYTGTVTQYDKETGWYRVVYEDGDFEDLEWHELQEVLEPLDITVPLKSLALRIIGKGQKSEIDPGTKLVGVRGRGAKAEYRGGRRRGST